MNDGTDDFEDDYTESEYAGDDESGAGGDDNEPEKESENDDEDGYRGDDDEDDEQEPDAGQGGEGADAMSTLFEGLGIDGGLVTLDGEEVPFLQLPADEQRNIISQRLEAEYERGRAEANPEEGLDAAEIALVNYRREHGTIEGFEVTSGLEGLSADELHRRDIRAIDPEASEQEIEEELVARRSLTNFEKRAGTIRGRFEQQATQQREAAASDQAQQYQQSIVQTLAGMREIEGFPLESAEHDFIRRELTVAGEDGLAPFFRDLGDPQVQGRLAYLNRMFPAIVKGFEAQVAEAFEEGRRAALGKAPRKPTTPTGAAPAGKNRRQSYDEDTIGDYGHRR